MKLKTCTKIYSTKKAWSITQDKVTQKLLARWSFDLSTSDAEFLALRLKLKKIFLNNYMFTLLTLI